MPETIEFAALSDVGLKRESNEDSYVVDKDLGVFIVCDGLGGHNAGEVASQLASKTLLEHVRNSRSVVDEYLNGGGPAGRLKILEMLDLGANIASNRVHAQAALEPEKRGMGTTMVAALVLGAQAFIVHVGDSRLYLLRSGRLEQVTEDHNAMNDLVKRRGVPLEQVADMVKRNRMTRAIGIYECVETDTLMLDLADGDRLLLCSDGLSRHFDKTPAELGNLLATDGLDATTQRLIDAANSRGGQDNVTAIVVGVHSPDSRDSTRVSRIERARTMLTRIPLFKRLDQREQLHILQIMQVVKFPAGEVVIREGEDGDRFFIVLKGAFLVTRKGAPIRPLGPGEHFGEMALIRNRPRVATVAAQQPGELLAIGRTDFYAILQKKPRLAVKILWAFARTLASRLEDAHVSLEQLREDPDELTGEFLLSEPSNPPGAPR